MAAKVPDVAGEAYYIANPRSVRARPDAAGTALRFAPNDRPDVLSFGFSDIDDGDTWAVSTTWRGPLPLAHALPDAFATSGVSAHTSVSGTTLTVTFETNASNIPTVVELHLQGM
jgi:hypothetical protein